VETADKSAWLDYVGRVHQSLFATGSQINKVLVGQTIGSILCIAAALGLVPVSADYNFVGLKLSVSVPILFCGAAIVIASLLMYQLGLIHHEEILRGTLERIYKSLGVDDVSMQNRLASPLEHPGVVTTVLAQSRLGNKDTLVFRLSRLFSFALFLGLPLATQVIVGYQLISMRKLFWLAPVCIVFVLSVWHLGLYFYRGRKT